nr:oxidative stress-responsive serine-rich protein 1-like [Lepeophtheirus salmonis]
MKKTEHGSNKNEGGDDELLIRPFKKLKVSRVGKQDEKSLSCWSSSPKNHLSTSSPASPSSIILASSAPTVRGSLRFKPSRLSSVHSINNHHSIKEVSTSSSTTTQAKENLSSSWRSTDEGKDFSSVIIRRFDTISLSGKRKKKIREMGEDVQEEFVVENGGNKAVNCATQARQSYNDVSVDDLAGYLENSMVFPKKMSYMAEMMYT